MQCLGTLAKGHQCSSWWTRWRVSNMGLSFQNFVSALHRNKPFTLTFCCIPSLKMSQIGEIEAGPQGGGSARGDARQGNWNINLCICIVIVTVTNWRVEGWQHVHYHGGDYMHIYQAALVTMLHPKATVATYLMLGENRLHFTHF